MKNSEIIVTSPIRQRRRSKGVGGHLSESERAEVLGQWIARSRLKGTVREIATRMGVSDVTVSNIVLAETGKRPIYHNDTEPTA